MKRYLLVFGAISLAALGTASAAFAQASVLGASFPIYAATARGSAVAYDSRNNVYLVVSAYGAVNGRFVSADGVPLTACTTGDASFLLGGASFGHFPRVAYSPDANGGLGGFVVTWHEADSVAGGNAIHARSVSLASCLGPEYIVSNTIDTSGAAVAGDKTYWETGAAIAYSSVSKRFLVAWRSLVSPDGSPNDINARLLDVTGAPLGAAPLKITATGIYEDNPSVAYNPAADQFLVSFAGYDSSAFVAVRLVSASTAALGGQYELTRSGGTYMTDAAFINATGRFLVTWYQLPGGTTGRLVNGQSGGPEGEIIPLSTRFGANDALSVAYNPISATSFLVSHDQSSTEDGGLEISTTGVPSAGFGVTSIGGKGNFYPRIAASTSDRRWMLSTANVFQTIYGQFIATGSSGSGAAAPVPTAPPPPPPPVTIAPVQAAALRASIPTPISVGTPITWTAAASGGSGVLEYQFMRFTQGIGWSVAQAYSSSNTYTWFPPVGQNALQVWVRSSGSSASYDAYMSTGMFTVVPTARLTSFTTNAAFPAAYNIPLTFTATATGGAMTQYKFFTYAASAGGWKLAQDYSSSNTFTWFPPLGQNAVQVWVRAANSTADYDDWASIGLFSVITTPPRVTAFFSNVPFPAAPNTTQIWSAFAVGSVPLEYKFLRFDEGAGIWSIVRDWGPTNQAYYTPGVAGAGWQAMQVWVRGIGSTAAYEAWSGTDYMLVSASTGINLVSNRPLTGLRVGDMVTWTASVTGGAGPWEYKFMTYDYRGWIVQQGYTTQNTFSWYPPAGSCAMQVWIRTAGSHASWERYMSSGMFVVTP